MHVAGFIHLSRHLLTLTNGRYPPFNHVGDRRDQNTPKTTPFTMAQPISRMTPSLHVHNHQPFTSSPNCTWFLMLDWEGVANVTSSRDTPAPTSIASKPLRLAHLAQHARSQLDYWNRGAPLVRMFSSHTPQLAGLTCITETTQTSKRRSKGGLAESRFSLVNQPSSR